MMNESEIQKILEDNTRALQENTRLLRRMQRRILLSQILSWMKILIIAVPLIIAYFYLKPYYRDTMKMYRDLLGGANAGQAGFFQEFSKMLMEGEK